MPLTFSSKRPISPYDRHTDCMPYRLAGFGVTRGVVFLEQYFRYSAYDLGLGDLDVHVINTNGGSNIDQVIGFGVIYLLSEKHRYSIKLRVVAFS